MSRGIEIEIDDERGRSSSRDHRRDALDKQVQERLPKEALVWQLDRDSIPVERELPERDVRDSVDVRGSDYRLRQTEVDSLRDIGRFRVVEEQDLRRFGYAGDMVRMREDIRSLREQGLIERHRVDTDEDEDLAVFTLTSQGRQVAETIFPSDSQQRYYDGFVKTSEAEHDAALYRMFQAEEGRIHRNGGAVKRVVLDFELKRDVYSYLANCNSEQIVESARGRRESVGREPPQGASIRWSKLLAPGSNCFVGHRDAALREKVFDIVKAEGEPMIQPNNMADDFRGKAMAFIR